MGRLLLSILGTDLDSHLVSPVFRKDQTSYHIAPKPSQKRGNLEHQASSVCHLLHAKGEWMSLGPIVAEAQASPANSLQAPGGVGIEVAVEGSKPAGERAKEGQVTVFTPVHIWRMEDLSLTSHPTSGTRPDLQSSRIGCSPLTKLSCQASFS